MSLLRTAPNCAARRVRSPNGTVSTDMPTGSVYGTEDPSFGRYGSDQRALDEVLYANPHLISVWASGNDRSDSFTNARGDGFYMTYLSTGPNRRDNVEQVYITAPMAGRYTLYVGGDAFTEDFSLAVTGGSWVPEPGAVVLLLLAFSTMVVHRPRRRW